MYALRRNIHLESIVHFCNLAHCSCS
uniref:Uncharacterized protein n=1 Tax=Rhizophora mucronata TaxID=61149 RepID=A0A2P2Q549_RHIMU